MREIKFRAWDKDRKIMVFSMDGFVEDFDVFSIGNWCNNAGYELMQYVGLKDKNGVEIYDGDIVLEWGWSEANDYDSLYPLDKKHVVSLDNFRMWLKGESFGYEGEELINPENCEVIGNIHEHSQLMETK